jgi:hypothetical protein
MLAGARRDEIASRCETDMLVKGRRESFQAAAFIRMLDFAVGYSPGIYLCQICLSHQQAWSSGYDFCLTTQVFGYTEGSEFDSQGL